MDIILYMWEDYESDEFSAKIITLLQLVSLEFKVHSFEKDTDMEVVSKTIGEKVRKLPQIEVDGERIGGYYDLVEHLINKEVINYAGKPKWNTNN
jgi:glutaredoxin